MSKYWDLCTQLEDELRVLRAAAEGAIAVCNEIGGKDEGIAAGLSFQLYRVEELFDSYAAAVNEKIKSLESK